MGPMVAAGKHTWGLHKAHSRVFREGPKAGEGRDQGGLGRNTWENKGIRR